jgi:hypothetical protein
MRFLVPVTTSPGRAPWAAGRPFPPRFRPWGVSPLRRFPGRPGLAAMFHAAAVQDLPRPEPSPRAQHVHPSRGRCVPRRWSPARAWCDVRSLDPPGFPDARLHPIALMGATWRRWPGSPRGSCVRFHATAFEGDRASPAPSGPYAGLTRHFTSSLGLGALLRARVRSRPAPVSRRRAAVALLGVAPPEPSSGPVLGPFVPRAVTPRVRSSFTTPRDANPGRRG